MNILYVNSKKNWGGICSWTEKTALGLQKKGHYCFIVAHPDGLFAKKADKSLHIIKRRFGFDYNPVTIWFFVKFIKSKKIDIVVVNTEKEVMAGGIAAKICKIPVIRRNGNERDFSSKLRIKLHQKFLVDTNVVPCKSMYKEIENRFTWVNLAKLRVIYNGRDLTNYNLDEIKKIKSKWGVSDSEIILGVTSQLSPTKRVDTIINIFEKLVSTYDFLHLVIYGEGKEKSKLIELVRKLNLYEKVFFGGFTDNPLLIDSCYDIGISFSEYEGFPNNVVEYMAAGCAVVVADVNGCREIVNDGVNGFLVNKNNEKMLEIKLSKLINNENLRTIFSNEAKKSVKEKFSEKIMIDEIEREFLKNAFK